MTVLTVGVVATIVTAGAAAPAAAAATGATVSAAGAGAAAGGAAGVVATAAASGAATLTTVAGSAGGGAVLGAVGGAVAGGTAGAAATGAATGAATAAAYTSASAGMASVGTVTSILSGPVGWIVLGTTETEISSIYTFDCWKQVLHDDSCVPSKGKMLREVAMDPRIKRVTATINIDNADLPHLIFENIWYEQFLIEYVSMPADQLTAHAVKL